MFFVLSPTSQADKSDRDATGATGERLYRAWQLKELLRNLLKYPPIAQVGAELKHWVFGGVRQPDQGHAIRMVYGYCRVGNLIGLIVLRCGGLDIRLLEPTN